MAKKQIRSIVHSRQLEESINVPITLVGTPTWLHESISEGTIAGRLSPHSSFGLVEVLDAKDLAPIILWLRAQPVLGLDSETGGENKRDGLDPVAATSRMLIFQLGTTEMVYLIEPALVPYLKEVLEDPAILFITQNGVHDFKFTLAKYGIHFINHTYDPGTQTLKPGLYDTMLAEQLISAGLFGVSVGLEELAEKYDPHHLISKAVRKEFIDMHGVLEFRHLYYAARDVYLLFDIRKAQLELVKKYPRLWERMQVEFCAISGTADAELTGFNIDEVRLGYTIEYWTAKAERIRSKVTEIYNAALEKSGNKRKFVMPDTIEDFDLDSPSQKLEALRKLGYELKDTKRETLNALDSEIAKLLGEYSECTKIISTYGEGLLKKKSKTTGRLHPEFNQLGSGDLERRKGGKTTTIATGRWSSDAQQFPRPDHIFDPVKEENIEAIKALFPDTYAKAVEEFNKSEASSGNKK